MAVRLASDGAAVVVNDLEPSVAAETVAEIELAGGRAVAAPGSVSDVSACEELVAAAEEAYGGLDILVNNAGVTADAWLHRMSDAEWALTNNVMLTGTFQMCRAAARLLRRPGGEVPAYHRKVVNIASINGLYGVAGNVNYSAAKAGIVGLTKALAREWAPLLINANVVAPGFIEGTRLTSAREDGDVLGVPPDVLERIQASMPMGRGGTPEDVAGVVAFMSSVDSDFITGQVIEVSGGREIVELV
jgi:3-oxoacyl-[acyl-carrier protein] reductase